MYFKNPIKKEDAKLINKILDARKVKRNMKEVAKIEKMTLEEAIKKYGQEGEFYTKFCEFSKHKTIVDINTPPKGVPGLYCPFCIEADDNDNFIIVDTFPTEDTEFVHYEYAHWIQWLIDKILKPMNYDIADFQDIYYNYEEWNMSYKICVKNNVVSVYDIIISYSTSDSFSKIQNN
ncbi:MAG: hypothetical protein LKF87_14635 [Clostridium tyrobutyricum]|jgi:hypothetical protein|uniref:hypothetical protein n=1 Tax=Clostridium tyrobutyricum TaxID=1519 RepID=UPI002432E107|nr:hypothetical protein [Clostridium tyrobutyricum]MCH4200641.1 hypothetical protein [Clostridium tyrobutyricum]MCH4237539.1 hypothetical protein [Clostridium tyrobutyricum]MCH4260150.1 hypothetical protein [Clostridium tyrobutyricum]MCI2011740.1 hypothetical protein [Clostridium tyrobutyricum]